MRRFVNTVSSVAVTLMLATSIPAYAVTDQEIRDFINANANDPAAIDAAMKKHGVTFEQIEKAGFSKQQVDSYVGTSNNASLKDAYNKETGSKLTDKQIQDFINANADDPSKIDAAMKQYGVTFDRLEKAGYTQKQMSDYVDQSKSAALKESMIRAQMEKNPIYSNLPDFMKGTSGGQAAAVIRSESDIDKLPIWQGMSPTAAAEQKAKLKAALAGAANNDGSYVMGINGMQIAIPGRNDPQRDYPPLSTKDIAALKDQLNKLQPATNQAQTNLQNCVKTGGDCEKEREAFNLARSKSMDLGSQIAAAEAGNAVRATDDPQKKLNASVDSSISAQNAYLACTSAAHQTGSNCSAQAELAKKQLAVASTAARELVNQCISAHGAQSAKCAPLYEQAHAQDNNLTKFTSEVQASAMAKELASNAVSISLPASGETKTLANGYTVDSKGVIKQANGTAVGVLTEQGKFVDTNNKPLATEDTTKMLQLFTTPAGASVLGLKSAAGNGC